LDPGRIQNPNKEETEGAQRGENEWQTEGGPTGKSQILKKQGNKAQEQW
jgi:hypothetical protein